MIPSAEESLQLFLGLVARRLSRDIYTGVDECLASVILVANCSVVCQRERIEEDVLRVVHAAINLVAWGQQVLLLAFHCVVEVLLLRHDVRRVVGASDLPVGVAIHSNWELVLLKII